MPSVSKVWLLIFVSFSPSVIFSLVIQCFDIEYFFLNLDEISGNLPEWCKLYGSSDGWKCSIRSWFEFCNTCLSDGTDLGQKVKSSSEVFGCPGSSFQTIPLWLTNFVVRHAIGATYLEHFSLGLMFSPTVALFRVFFLIYK